MNNKLKIKILVYKINYIMVFKLIVLIILYIKHIIIKNKRKIIFNK